MAFVKFRGVMKKTISLSMAAVLVSMAFFPYLPPTRVQAAETGNRVVLTTAHGDFGGPHKLYCIDKGGLAIWGIADDGDRYECRRPSEAEVPLSQKEQEYVFWGIITLQASLGVKEAVDVIKAINTNAQAQGKTQINKYVTEEDLKALIYSSSVRAKYPWLETVAADTETYLKLGGLIGGKGGNTQSGKTIPGVIANSSSVENAYQIRGSDFTIHFDEGGGDGDFIQKVPLLFSNDNGAVYSPVPTDGWTYVKTNNSIVFSNPSPDPPKALIKFATLGTEYNSTGGVYASREELFEQCLQIWECVTCSGTHTGGTPPSSFPCIHQRMVWLEFHAVPVEYYAILAGNAAAGPASGGIVFQVFRHEEDFTSTYKVQLYKYDHETGMPLEDARFVLFERFDDKGEVNTDRDGPVYIYEGGDPYASYHADNPVIWEGFRKVGSAVTDEQGHIDQTIEHGYHYDKTFCDGHPAPAFTAVPEAQRDEETKEILNQDEIETAKSMNRELALAWIECVDDCEEKAGGAFSGVHFHWIMNEVKQGSIKSIASTGGEEGSTPDGGDTSEPDPETAYEQSGCLQDVQDTYDKFISLKYSYAFAEFQARDGYIRHDIHRDDLPVEIITTDASENGANAFFSGEYGEKDNLEQEMAARARSNSYQNQKGLRAIFTEKSIAAKASNQTVMRRLYQRAQIAAQEITAYLSPYLEENGTVGEDGSEEAGRPKGMESPGEADKPERMEKPEEADRPEEMEIPGEADRPEEMEIPGEAEKPEEMEKPEEADKLEEMEIPGEAESQEGADKPEEAKRAEDVIKQEETEKNQEIKEASEEIEEPEWQEQCEPEDKDSKPKSAASLQREGNEETEGDLNDPKPEISVRPSEIVFSTDEEADDTFSDFQFIDEDEQETGKALAVSPLKAATPSSATPSDAVFRWRCPPVFFRNPEPEVTKGGLVKELFTPAYEEAISAASVGEEADKGPDGHYSHCGNVDSEGDAWRVFDHRTEGEVHINKKDVDLAEGETDSYNACGDAQGDAALEGAVYGLFAAADIVHPDGKTGVVYRANNLAAVATTDKNGDASFLVNTEAPGFIFDYKKGEIVESLDGWAVKAPKNLYDREQSFDDYTQDGQYERTYQNNEQNNGNCWIGRPLLLGDYYVKELSRSEGYELSIGNRENSTTNLGQDLEAKAPAAADGYAVMVQPLSAEEQTSEDGKGAGPNELFFASRSTDTRDQKYEIVLWGLPEGTEFYRKDTGSIKLEAETGTGVYEKVLLTNPDGTPKYIRAENDYQYLKYDAEGSLMTRDEPINFLAERFRQVSVRPLDETAVQRVINQADEGMTEDENWQQLYSPFAVGDFSFMKGKVETALRRNGKATPRSRGSTGGVQYSTIYTGIFDRGVREGESDPFGLSGVTPGSPAAFTVYGAPVQKISIARQKADGSALTAGDAILSVLDFYNSHPYYSYGGIDTVEESGSHFIFTIYASVTGNPDNFMVLGSDPESDSLIYHAVKHVPEQSSSSPRIIYAAYSNNPDYGAFGTYEDYREVGSKTSVIGSAALITDAAVDDSGNLCSRTIKRNVYYQTGELARDENGDLMQAFEYREIKKTVVQDVEDVKWTKIPAMQKEDGTYVITVEASYKDAFGNIHTNAGTEQTIEWKAVLEQKAVTLTEEETAALGNGFLTGQPMNSAAYYIHIKRARANAYLDYQNTDLTGGNTYITLASLSYPGQEKIFQDDGTRRKPAQVFERVIRQKVKVVKDIQTAPDKTYEHNTNANSGHSDHFTRGPGSPLDSASKLPDFRFKVYLKSNLERLYRDEKGEVSWLDRDGNEVEISEFKKKYPEKKPFGKVQKIYTEVLHRSDSSTTGSIANNVWEEAVTANDSLYSVGPDGLVMGDQNPGYTRLLETISQSIGEEAGKTRLVRGYNYKKFFDAIRTANHDKWDQGEDSSTSFKPFSFIREKLFGTKEAEVEYPASHNNTEIENKSNTSDAAKENAGVSDAVRQFAISWYLDEEVKKLTERNEAGENQAGGGRESYQEEIYDAALQRAVIKAENYLKPFFMYDLDEVYSIAWDSEIGGGSDKDPTTLSAGIAYGLAGNGQDTPRDGYFYGVSSYLPYGVYVAVEQQPYSAQLGDFYNKHYKVDLPKEIVLPSLYEPGGNVTSPEFFNTFYKYQSADSPEELQKKYFIRWNSEWADTHTDDLRGYVIRAHNNDGDFEVFKFGLDSGRLTGTISYPGDSYDYQGFCITQDDYNPYKDIYEAENKNSDYRSNQTVEQYYRYGAVSERNGISDHVLYQHGGLAGANNPSGFYFKDQVKTVTGALTAFDGKYAAALVPWTVNDPADPGVYDASGFAGYADGKYRNTFYNAKLRLDKLDSETGENILHDSAVFAIYSADREDSRNSLGRVKFYEKDTVIVGSKEFLEAMGARNITPFARPSLPWGIPYLGKYFGTVCAGTPICRENEQIVMTDKKGEKTGNIRVYSTTGDIQMRAEEDKAQEIYADQTIGFLETPEPLGAGCYVLAEIKAPAGYVRSRPIAIEIYSDQIAYYLDGNQDRRVLSAIYDYDAAEDPVSKEAILNPDRAEKNKNKPQEQGEIARVYVNNTPLRLEVAKIKPDKSIASYELNGRLEGSLVQLKAEYGLENLELAYNASGTYLGYGWKKGFLDSLKQKQAAGERITILYEGGIFTGKAILNKALETADYVNRYLPGAKMTLYDAIEVKPSSDSEDYRYDGVNIERDHNGNVSRMFVQKGYAGTKVLYVLNKNLEEAGEEDYKKYTWYDQEDDKGAGTWIGKTVDREDTDILFYNLGDLDVLREVKGVLYGYDREGKQIQVKDGSPAFALKNGAPFLEIACNDYRNLHYSKIDHVFSQVPEGTRFYHLNEDGGRDSEVDPYTGMAYVVEAASGKVLVWPVRIAFDTHGNVLARDKIATSRIASIYADTEEEYTIGTYDSLAGRLQKWSNPALNRYGLPVYYQRSDERYQKGRPIYDRDGDYVRYQYDDRLSAFNDNAYQIKRSRELSDIGGDPETESDDQPLYHRQGESYLMENTWITGEKAPNDPFTHEMTDGKADVLKRVAAGTYILEEVEAPEGYRKIMPIGITVRDTGGIQTIKAEDQPIAAYFEKLDAPDNFQRRILDKDGILDEEEKVTEGKGSFSYQPVEGAKLALYRARRIYSDDLKAHPKGYYLEKKEGIPAAWTVLDETNQRKRFTASWTTRGVPEYLETIPRGDYILEEIEAPSGFVRSSLEIEIKEQEGLQYFALPNDHTKIEIYKYREEDGEKLPLENKISAKLALFEAVTDSNGIVFKNGNPQYDKNRLVEQWTTDDCRTYVEGDHCFTRQYQVMFEEYGTSFDKFSWGDREGEQAAHCIFTQSTDREECVRQIWKNSDGREVLIEVAKNLGPEGRYGYTYDYKFNYKKIETELCPNAVSYDTAYGAHRIDYLPMNGKSDSASMVKRKGYYVLVEIKTPDGFIQAAPKPVVVQETADIQLYSLKNEPVFIEIEKVSKDGISLEGAGLALYRAAADGSFVMDSSHLTERWESHAGKCHRISPIPFGTYYLVEWKAPAGYEKMKPRRLEVTPESDSLVTAVNRLKKGKVILEKADEENGERKLAGAVFEIKNKDTGECFLMVTDDDGRAESEVLEIGKTGEAGVFFPYHFSVRELAPPENYQLNFEIHEFYFTDDQNTNLLTYELACLDARTEISVSKSVFGSSVLLKGAQLAVYGTKTENGKYEMEGEPIEEWLSDGTAHIIRGKLSAGKTYLLKELRAPNGYHLAVPLLFTISDDGRKITYVGDDRNIIKVQASSQFKDAVESLSILGRLAERTEIMLTDLDTGEVFEIPSWRGGTLTAEDGLIEGHRYEEKEITHYSDGSRQASARTVFRLHFREDGSYMVRLRRAEETRLCLENQEGDEMESWIVENRDDCGYVHTIYNPEYKDWQGIEAAGSYGRHGSGVSPGSVVKYRINWKNETKRKKDIQIEAIYDPQTEYMERNSTEGGQEMDDRVVWTIPETEPGDFGEVIFTAAVKEDAEECILNRVIIEGSEYSFLNPLLLNGGLTIRNQVSGTAKTELEAQEFSYEITLLDSENEPLKGYCPYTGSRKGRLKSGDVITLRGGEFITLSGMAWGTRYRIRENPLNTEESLERYVSGAEGVTGRQGRDALFLYRKSDDSVREFLKKGEAYRLVETTVYSDKEAIKTNEISFTLNENAAIDNVAMADRPTHVTVSKTDIAGERELPGAKLTLQQLDGTVIDEWISTDKPHELAAVLKPGESYILTEVSPPDGYAFAKSLTFTVSEDGLPVQVRMEDRETQVEIVKTGQDSQDRLIGAELELCDSEGNFVDRWTTDGEFHRITGRLMAGGTYTLSELSAPAGYRKAKPVTFTVSLDGKTDRVGMEDMPTRVVIEKKAAAEEGSENLEFLEGARIQIQDLKGRLVYQFISKPSPEEITGVLEAGEVYIAREVEAPYGYELAPPIQFRVPEDEEKEQVITICMEDKRIQPPDSDRDKERPDRFGMILKKYDGISLNGLSGAVFAIYKEDGSLSCTVTTKEDGRVMLPWLAPGSYTAIEMKAPEGYLLSEEEYSFIINDGEEQQKELLIPNYPAERITIAKEDQETGERLPGAELIIFDERRNVCGQGTTDKDGVFFWIPPRAGSYTVEEKKAPRGYQLLKTGVQFTVDRDGKTEKTWTVKNELIGPGIITAFYEPDTGWLERRDSRSPHFPKTGDENWPFWVLAIGLLLSFSLAVFTYPGKKWILMLRSALKKGRKRFESKRGKR